MEEATAEEIITLIKKKHHEVKTFDAYRESSYAFEHRITELRDLVHQLEAFEEHKGNADMTVGYLNHTLGKEVAFTHEYYKESIKRNAAKKRKTEYYESVNEAISQVATDLVWLGIDV